MLSDKECMIVGVSRNTYYKYEKELDSDYTVELSEKIKKRIDNLDKIIDIIKEGRK